LSSWLSALWQPFANLPGFAHLPGAPALGASLPPTGGTGAGSGTGTGTGSGSGTGSTTGPAAAPGALSNYSYSDSAGNRDYTVYVPSSYKKGTPMPLVVALHGCTESGDVMRQLTGLDSLADSTGFIVVYPTQPSSANNQSCWNWFQQSSMQRGSGEASI